MAKKILILILALLLPVMTVSAVTINKVSIIPKENGVLIEGTANDGDVILMSVIKDDESMEFSERLAYQDGIIVEEDGNFEFEFKMNGAGLYEAIASIADETSVYKFAFSDDETVQELLKLVNATTSISEMETLLYENRYSAGLYIYGLSEPDYEAVARLTYNNKPYAENDTSGFISTMNRFYLMNMLENEQIDNVFTYKMYTGILDVANIDVFDEEIFTNSHEVYATELLMDKKFESSNEFTNGVVEASVLAVIQNPNGFGNVKKVIKAFENEIGIDADKGSDVVFRKLQGLELDNYDELREKFNELCAQYSSGSGGGSGSSGGGSGGSGSSGGSGGKEVNGSGYISYGDRTAESIDEEETQIKYVYFSDIENYAWAAESINALANKGIVAGKENGKFCPGDYVTRSEFIKLIVEAFDIADGSGELPFDDVYKNAWDYKYIKAGYNAGIIKGMSDKMFGGGVEISRQDMAVILLRAATLDNRMANIKFADDMEISGYAYDAVYMLKGAGVLNGDNNNRFNPKHFATRAEAAKVIYSVIK